MQAPVRDTQLAQSKRLSQDADTIILTVREAVETIWFDEFALEDLLPTSVFLSNFYLQPSWKK